MTLWPLDMHQWPQSLSIRYTTGIVRPETQVILNMSDSAQRTLRTILSGIPGILALKNKGLAYEVVNPELLQFLGKGPEEILGKTDDQLFPQAEAAAAAKEQKSVLNSGIPRNAELTFSGKNGQRWFDLAISAVMDDNGDPDGVMIAGHDITDFKQREAAIATAEARVTEAQEAANVANEKLKQVHEEAKNLEIAAQQVQDHLKQREKQLAQALKQTSVVETQLQEAQTAQQAAQAALESAQAELAAAQPALASAQAELFAARDAQAAAEARIVAAEAAAAGHLAELEALKQRQQAAAALARQLTEQLGQ